MKIKILIKYTPYKEKPSEDGHMVDDITYRLNVNSIACVYSVLFTCINILAIKIG